MKVLLLCAGFGTRLGAVAKGRPKALLPIVDKPLVEHLVDALVETGCIDEVHVVTNARFVDQFEVWAETLRARGLAVAILNDGATENANRLGAVRDLALAVERHSLSGPLLVAAGDNLFDFPLVDLFADHAANPRTLVAAKHEPDVEKLRRTGVAEIGPDGRLVRLHEKPVDPPSSYSCPALYLFEKAALDLLPRFLAEAPETDAPGHFIAWLAEHHPVYTHMMNGDRLDIGDPEGYRAAEAWLLARRGPPSR